jgi:hypothetical protein
MLGSGMVNMFYAIKQVSHTCASNEHVTIDELLEAVFSSWSDQGYITGTVRTSCHGMCGDGLEYLHCSPLES